MKYLLYSACSYAHPHFGVLLDEAERLHKEGHEVIFTYCSGVIDSCFMNPQANKARCKLCKLCYNTTLSKLSKGILVVPLKDINSSEKYSFTYNSIDEIKNIKYRNVYVGYSVLSTYISITRNPYPEISIDSKKYFDHLIEQTCRLTSRVYELVEKHKPNVISIYNGRFFENRPFYDIAKFLNLQFISNEVVGGPRSNELFSKVSFNNCLPHDIQNNCDTVKFVWNSSDKDTSEKIIDGESFFTKRRNGLPAADKVYINGQVKGLMPSNWDDNKKNIVIFNSSEDEFAAIGKDFEEYSLFKSQIDGIKYLLSSINDKNYHFYLRVHPNLKNIPYKYHTDLYTLEKDYDNITVIKASDSVSTYDIMDKADKVVVFGSTMGVEASFWHKPVVLLSGAMYYYLDMCYIPRSQEELSKLLKEDLKPKSNLAAIFYGYYMMNRNVLSTDCKYFDINYKTFILGNVKINMAKYLTILGSNKLMKLILVIWLRTIPHLIKNKINMPDPFYKE